MVAILYLVVTFVVVLTGSAEALVDWILFGALAVPLLMLGAIVVSGAEEAQRLRRARRERRLAALRRLRRTDLREMYRNERGK